MLFVKRIIVGALESNCYLVYNKDKNAVVIDPGADAQLIVNNIENLNLSVQAILLTHAHFDHMGAAQILADKFNCEVIVHNDDVPLLRNADLNLSSRFFGDEMVYCGAFRAVGEEKINLLGELFSIIHTPGHTPGSICIKIDKFLFTGDTLFYMSIGNSFEPYGNIAKELESISQKLFSIDEDLVCYPGHGDTTSLLYEKTNNPYFM